VLLGIICLTTSYARDAAIGLASVSVADELGEMVAVNLMKMVKRDCSTRRLLEIAPADAQPARGSAAGGRRNGLRPVEDITL
jgi:hypothetical protein